MHQFTKDCVFFIMIETANKSVYKIAAINHS